jgi:DNA repair ATPase RecN
MATKQENPQKDNWWLNELESLGVSPKTRNELNNMQEISNLTENIKQIFYQAYKAAYNDDSSQNSSNVQIALI